jgi:hypothetical protein
MPSGGRVCRPYALHQQSSASSVVTSGRTKVLTRRRLIVIAAVAALCPAACSSDSVPTSPTGPGVPTNNTEVLTLDVVCPAALLIGEREPCIAVASYRSGQQAPVFDAMWSSRHPDIVAIDARGVVSGRTAGQAIVSASYRGREGVAPVSVNAQDAVKIKAAAEQGEFRPGTTATMWLQGYYSVASADTARLALRISDQAGTLTTTTPQIVARGGDFFLLSATFVVPQQSTRVCRAVILEVGSVTIAEPPPDAGAVACLPILN